jgi:hypothetical protein
MSLLSDYIRKVGGDVSNTELPPATEPGTHGDPLNGLLSAGWEEVGQDSDGADYKHTDFPGQLITLNYADGAWDHTYYDDQVASGTGAEDLRAHLAEWHGEQKQLESKKAWDLVRATEINKAWAAAGCPKPSQAPLGFELAFKFGSVRFLDLDTIAKKAPTGWEGTVLAMKEHPEIDNVFALANWMKDQGDTLHYLATSVSKFCEQTKCP